MFSKKNPEGGAASTGNESSADNGRPEEASPPPLKPFAKPGGDAPLTAPRSTFHPDIPARTPDIPGLPPRRSGDRARDTDQAKTLMVGSAIHLKGGEISNCERLVVEGKVEDSVLTDSKRVEVLAGGTFKGKASVEEAVISGHFDGELTASTRLTVRETGRISGSVRYGSIVIEPGGEIRGDMQTLGTAPAPGNSTTGDDGA
ncbi:MAG: polymer-forming cytoskeletal protein [Rhodospirillales bacterium]